MDIETSKILTEEDLQVDEDMFEIDEILEFEEILLSISETIMEYRKEEKLTQKQLAEKIKCRQEMISKLESGQYNPSFKNIHKISRKMNNSSEFFIKILEDIIDKIKEVSEETYSSSFMQSDYKYDISKKYVEPKGKVIYVKLKNVDNSNKIYGGMNDEWTSCIPNVG